MGQWVEGAATFTVQSSSKKETVPINMYMYYIIKVLPTATVPVGAVVPFAGQGKEAPSYFDGVWAVCEGDKLPSSRFTKIYAVIGKRYGSTPDGSEFLLPNLQGIFIRGVDINTGRDQNANRTPPPGLPGTTASVAGSTQTADNGPPSVPWTVTIQHAPDGNTVHEVFEIAGHTNTRNDDYVFDISWFGGDKETRPVNVAVQYLISLIDHNTVSDNTDTLPIGSIIAFPGVGKPNNKYWALCDGSEVSTVDEQYTKLFKICGSIWGQSESGKFNLPDLRGRFLRGTDNTPDAPVDPDRDNRTNLYPGGATKGTGSAQSFGTSTKNVSANIGRPTRHWDNAAGGTANKAMAWNPDSNVYNVQGGDQETRPINIAVFFYVKCYSELV
jgi:microcystin-dependent protein